MEFSPIDILWSLSSQSSEWSGPKKVIVNDLYYEYFKSNTTLGTYQNLTAQEAELQEIFRN